LPRARDRPAWPPRFPATAGKKRFDVPARSRARKGVLPKYLTRQDRSKRRAELHKPAPKKGVYIRLDADVLDWLKSKGKGYQTRMNAMLRALMESDQRTR
jgi:uncharacterized protein (DUF4415 family)